MGSGSIDNSHGVCSKFEILKNLYERKIGEAVARGKTSDVGAY